MQVERDTGNVLVLGVRDEMGPRVSISYFRACICL